MERAVAQVSQPARIGRHVAADLARALGAEVERHRVAALPRVVLQRLEHAARLADQISRVLVQGDDLVHPAQREDNLVADGHRAACVAGEQPCKSSEPTMQDLDKQQ
eukprot:6187911-Pleurochrysis_carterae.AAC.2